MKTSYKVYSSFGDALIMYTNFSSDCEGNIVDAKATIIRGCRDLDFNTVSSILQQVITELED